MPIPLLDRAGVLLAAGLNPDPTSLTPDPTALPGTTELQHLADGVDAWALIAAVVGVLIGAVIWAFGHYSQNYQSAYNGRKGVMVSGLAAILIGAAPKLINFFVTAGGKIH